VEVGGEQLRWPRRSGQVLDKPSHRRAVQELSFRSEVLNDLAQKEKTIAELEKVAKMLSIS